MRMLLPLFLFLSVATLAGTLQPGQSGLESIDTLPVNEWDVKTDHQSLPVLLLLGTAVPGGAQFYTGHTVRGGFLAALELGLAVEVFVTKPAQQDKRFQDSREARDSVYYYNRRLVEDASPDSFSVWSNRRDLHLKTVRSIQDKKRAEEDLRNSELAWMLGLHLYGLMDGYGIWVHNQGRSTEHRSTSGAVWRALLVPGWGQVYNGEYGKAGMLWMAAVGSTVSFLSRQQMVEYFLDRRRVAVREGASTDEIESISEDLTFYRKKRNQYSWGMTLFYFYSIADAAVDAMLSDFDSPAQFAVMPSFDGAWAGIHTRF